MCTCNLLGSLWSYQRLIDLKRSTTHFWCFPTLLLSTSSLLIYIFSSAMFLFLAFEISWGLHLTSISLSAHHKKPSQELHPGNWPINAYYLPLKVLQCDYRKIFTSTIRNGSVFSAKWPHNPKHHICLVKCSFVNII